MRPISKTILAVAALTLGGFANCNAADDLALPPLPPPPPASGGSALPTVSDAPSTIPAPSTDTTTLPALPADNNSTLLPPPPAAATTTPTPTTLPAPTDNTFSTSFTTTPVAGGTQGRINGGRVNIRAGNSTKYEIILTANPETPVTVFERKGDWVTIAYPETEFCYINRQYIDGDIPADLPEQGIVRTVRGDNVNVRARPWPGSTVVGQATTGDTVIVTQLRGQWAKVRPPASARAYVFHKYVTYDPSAVKTADAAPSNAGNTSPDQYKKKVEIAVDDVKKQLQEQAKKDPILLKLRVRAEEERNLREARRKTTNKIVESIDAQLARIEQESSMQIKQIYQQNSQIKAAQQQQMTTIENGYVPPAPPGTLGGRASGWIEYVGYIGGRPAGFKLVKGGVTQYLIRSSRYDLNKFIGKRVLVSGAVTPAPAWEADVLSIDSMSFFGQPDKRLETIRITTPETKNDVTINIAPPTSGSTVIDVTGLPTSQH